MRRFKSMTSNSCRRAQQDQHVWNVGRVQHLGLLRAVRASLMIVMRTVMVVIWFFTLAGTALADETLTINYASVIGPVTHKGSGLFEHIGDPSSPRFYTPDSVLSQLHLQTVKMLSLG